MVISFQELANLKYRFPLIPIIKTGCFSDKELYLLIFIWGVEVSDRSAGGVMLIQEICCYIAWIIDVCFVHKNIWFFLSFSFQAMLWWIVWNAENLQSDGAIRWNTRVGKMYCRGCLQFWGVLALTNAVWVCITSESQHYNTYWTSRTDLFTQGSHSSPRQNICWPNILHIQSWGHFYNFSEGTVAV